MRFSDIRGHEDIKKAFIGMADRGRIPNAILMHENEGGGALALALAFMQYVNCKERTGGDSCGHCASCHQNSKIIFPDIHFTFPITTGTKVSGEASKLICDNFAAYWKELVLKNPYFLENELSSALGFEKKSGIISKSEGAAILQKLSLSSVTDGYRAIIIWLPEKMNAQTANMLLKSIEEPASKTIYILITHSPEDVLQTISSRCLRIRVAPVDRKDVEETLKEEFSIVDEEALIAAEFSGGSVGIALQSLSEGYENIEIKDLFKELIQNSLDRNYLSALETGEAIAALDSREKQKAFCTFAGECLRKIFMIQQGMEELAGVLPDDMVFYEIMAKKCKKSFSRNALAIIGSASYMLDRNVNQKIIFTNLVNRLFVNV